MQNNLQCRFFIDNNRHIAGVALFALLSLLITACSGGIDGTGDGGPVIIQPGDTIADVPDGGTSGVGSNPDSSAAPTANTGTPILPDLSNRIPKALLEAHNRNEQTSGSEPFIQQLILASADFEQINNELTVASGVTIGTAVDGYFDNSVEFSQPGRTTIKWSNDNTAISLSTANENRIVYLLMLDQTLTIRRFDRTNNLLFQAEIHSLPESGNDSILEATLNNNGALSYLRSYSSDAQAGNTAIFTQHPTDTNSEQRREIIDQSGTVIDIQTCTVTNSAGRCQSDTDWAVVNDAGSGNAELQFSTAINNIDITLELRRSPLTSLPQGVNEAVIATTDDTTATAGNIQCGLQIVDGVVRAFCIEPQPLEANGNLFQEILSGGEVFYQLLR